MWSTPFGGRIPSISGGAARCLVGRARGHRRLSKGRVHLCQREFAALPRWRVNLGGNGRIYDQWEFQDLKLKVLYHIRPYFLGIFPEIKALHRPYIW